MPALFGWVWPAELFPTLNFHSALLPWAYLMTWILGDAACCSSACLAFLTLVLLCKHWLGRPLPCWSWDPLGPWFLVPLKSSRYLLLMEKWEVIQPLLFSPRLNLVTLILRVCVDEEPGALPGTGWKVRDCFRQWGSFVLLISQLHFNWLTWTRVAQKEGGFRRWEGYVQLNDY